MRTDLFDYVLPDDAVAQRPVEPRDSARLLDTRDLSDHRFSDLPSLLRDGDLVVVNRTRVRPARLIGCKARTGGRVELLLLRRLSVDSGAERWEALVRPARRIRVGDTLVFGRLEATVASSPTEGVVAVELEAPDGVDAEIDAIGEIPLPPYITVALDAPERYQTIFADRPGSAAAPTAGLHFTADVVKGLDAAGIDVASVDLEVGLGTFRPITTEDIEDHVIHGEFFRLDEETAEAVAATRRRGGRIVAVGTTVTRVLESRAREGGLVTPGEGETTLYLRPGAGPSVVDLLVTNFHVPRSSLIVLVSSFMGGRWRPAYQTALARGYRFLSFGDAMLCARELS